MALKFGLKKEDRKESISTNEREIDNLTTLHKEEINESSEKDFNPWNYVRVVNVRGEPEFMASPDEKIIVGHRENPVLGNKTPMKSKTMAERDRVIEEHRKALEADLAIEGPIYHALKEIATEIVEKKQKIALTCYCAPSRCHNDLHIPVIVKMVKEILELKQKNKIKPK